jgi:hypothetical protein
MNADGTEKPVGQAVGFTNYRYVPSAEGRKLWEAPQQSCLA